MSNSFPLSFRYGSDSSRTIIGGVSCSSSNYLAITQCSFRSATFSSSCSDIDDVIVTCCKFLSKYFQYVVYPINDSFNCFYFSIIVYVLLCIHLIDINYMSIVLFNGIGFFFALQSLKVSEDIDILLLSSLV